MGTAEGQPGERHLYRMNVSSHDRHAEQLTDPILCEYNRIHMAPTFTSYVQVRLTVRSDIIVTSEHRGTRIIFGKRKMIRGQGFHLYILLLLRQ